MSERTLIRVGTLTAIYPERLSGRVEYEDRDNLVSAEMPFIVASASSHQFYALPAVGDNVLCLAPANDDSNTGFILGAFYNKKNPPPATSQKAVMIKFADGSLIKSENGTLNVTFNGTINLRGGAVTANGSPVARIGDNCSCGAKIISGAG